MDVDDDVIRKLLENTARTEERTIAIQRDLDDLKDRYVVENQKRDRRIARVENKTERNSVIISGGLFAVGSAVAAILAKLSDILSF